MQVKNLLWAIVLFPAFLFAVNISSAAEYGQVSGQPANPDPDIPNSSAWFIYDLESGKSLQDAVAITNNAENEMGVLIYAADTTPSSSGGFALKQVVEEKFGVGAWVRFYPEEIPSAFRTLFEGEDNDILKLCDASEEDLTEKNEEISEDDFRELKTWCEGVESIDKTFEPKEDVIIPFLFRVPEGTDVGEHTGGILIQKKVAEDHEEGGGAKITTRVGVRIYETVPGDIVKELSLENFTVEQKFDDFEMITATGEDKEKVYIVTTEVKNNGNVSVEHKNNIIIRDEKTGQEETIERSFHALKDDIFIANYQWTPPHNGTFTFRPEIIYNDADDNEQVIKADAISVSVMPLQEIAIGAALVLIIGVTILIVWLVRKKKYGGKNWVEHEVQVGENITMLAQSYGVDWKVLAKTNHIKAPYFLTPGDVITVPQSSKGKKSTAAAAAGTATKKKTSKQVKKETQNVEGAASPFHEDMMAVEEPMGIENEAEEEAAQKAKEKTSIAALAMEMQQKHTEKSDNLAFSDQQKKNVDVSWMKEDEKQYEKEVQPEKKRRRALMWKFVIWSVVVIGIVALALNLLTRFQAQEAQEPVSITNVAQNGDSDASIDNTDPMDEAANEGSASEENEDDDTTEVDDADEEVAIVASEVTVTVLNGGAATGQAGALTGAIGAKEYDTQKATNAKETIEGNIVYYGDEAHKAAAEDIATILKAEEFTPVDVKQDTEVVESVDSAVVVIIGA